MRAAEVFLFCWVWVSLGGNGDCKGLREEFTWTRINYTLPKGQTQFLRKDDYIYGTYKFVTFCSKYVLFRKQCSNGSQYLER